MPVSLASVSCRDNDTAEDAVSTGSGDKDLGRDLLGDGSACRVVPAGESFLPGGLWLRSSRKLEPGLVGRTYCKAGRAVILRFL